jgi:hypothetical protein
MCLEEILKWQLSNIHAIYVCFHVKRLFLTITVKFLSAFLISIQDVPASKHGLKTGYADCRF